MIVSFNYFAVAGLSIIFSFHMGLICSAHVALTLVTFRICALYASFLQPPSKSVFFPVRTAIIGQRRETLYTFPGPFYLFHVYMKDALPAPGSETTAMNSIWFLHKEQVGKRRQSRVSSVNVHMHILYSISAYTSDSENFSHAWCLMKWE